LTLLEIEALERILRPDKQALGIIIGRPDPRLPGERSARPCQLMPWLSVHTVGWSIYRYGRRLPELVIT
jgi:hypothetical protein